MRVEDGCKYGIGVVLLEHKKAGYLLALPPAIVSATQILPSMFMSLYIFAIALANILAVVVDVSSLALIS